MAPTNSSGSGKGIDFGLIFFSSSEAPFSGDKYRLVVESTRFADRHGFSSVWIPERHFTKDGWLYPNPAILQAALARETTRIHLRAGSVVMPLHNPLRVAEEWAMVDNLSGGRVGISFASGWHPNDFALLPENYETRNEVMYQGIETVRRLWRGESVPMKSGDGSTVELRTYPTPLQPELPIWITAAGNPKTFAGAGKIGAHILTHMYNHGVDELAEKIRIYRESLAEHGYDPAQGQVAVMLHTFVGPDEAQVRQQIREPFGEYLKSAAYLVNAIAYSRGQKVDLNSLSPQDLQDYLLFVTERLVSNQRVLFGTPESCQQTVSLLRDAGVTEIACQLDFGIDSDLALASLPYLHELKERCNDQRLEPLTSSYELSRTNGKHPGGNSPGAVLTAPALETVAMPVVVPQVVPPVPTVANPVVPGARVVPTPVPAPLQSDALPDVRRRCQEELSVTDFYQLLSDHGIQLGTSYQGIERLWRRAGEALGQIRLPAPVEQEAELYHIHPVLLDASFQVITAALPEVLTAGGSALYLPVGMRSFQVHKRPGRFVWSHARVGSASPAGLIEGDVRILDERGQLLAEATGLQLQRSEPLAPPVQPAQPASIANENVSLDDWLYELQWQETPLPALPPTGEPGHWLIFADKQGIGDRLGAQLSARGATFTKIVPGQRYGISAQGVYQVRPERSEEIRRLLQDVRAADNVPLRGVVHLWSLDATPAIVTSLETLERDQLYGTASALGVIQALAEQTTGEPPRLWLITRGAQPVAAEAQDMLEIAQAPLWGLGKTCAMEHPELWGGLIDLDADSSRDEAARQLVQAVCVAHQEDQLAFRQQRSYAARMVHAPALSPRPLSVRADASYLISGGLWGLGLEVARWLVQQGARELVLLGRTALPLRAEWDRVPAGSRIARQVAGLRSLEEAGARVHYAPVDVANETQLSAFLQDFARQDLPPIRGVIHAASVWQDAQGQSLVRPLANSSVDDLRAVFRPKVMGGWLLHTLLKDEPLDFFVSFSSGASLFGSAAQGNYAAAGEFLDILAHYQRAQGQPALSIDWGAVSELGFGATAEGLRVHEYWEERGIQRISPAQVLAALELLIPQDRARMGVLKLDWRLLQRFYPQITARPLVAHLVPADAGSAAQGESEQPAGNSSALQTILAASDDERLPQVQRYLSAQVANVLRISASRLDVAQPLTTLGLDSLMAIELKNRIELELNVRIPIVTFLQGPSIEQFSVQVLDQLQAQLPASSATETTMLVSARETLAPQQGRSEPATAASLEEQDAAQLLAQLDQLSDQDVEALLDQMLPEDKGRRDEQRGNGHHHTVTGSEPTPISAQDAERLLAKLDQLSDAEVDSLLSQIVEQGEESHE